MAWVTYDLIKERRENYSDDLPYKAVIRYLESLGFEVDTSTKSSHIHARTPDRMDMWTFTKHGGKSHLSPLEVKSLYDKLTDYFQREQAREAEKLETLRREQDLLELPEWFNAQYLADKGFKLRGDVIKGLNGHRTFVLLDRDYPELSVRITADTSHSPILTRADVENAYQRMKLIKENSYLTALHAALQPYKDLMHEKRINRDGQWFYQLVDDGDFLVGEIAIPNMEEHNPAERDHLLDSMITEIKRVGEKLASARAQLDARDVAAQAIEATRAADLEKRAAKRAEKDAIEAQRAAVARREKFQELAVRLGDLGFGVMVETERDGKRGFVYRQSEDALAIGRHYIALLEAIPEIPGAHVQEQVGMATRLLGKNLAAIYKTLPLLSLNKDRPGERFVAFTKDEQGYPTLDSIRRLEADVKFIEENSQLQTTNLPSAGGSSSSKSQMIKFSDKDGLYSISYNNFTATAPKDYNRSRAIHYLILKVFEQGALSLELNMMRDDLEAAGIKLSILQDNKMRLQTSGWNVDVAIRNGDVRPSFAHPDKRVIDGLKQAIETLIVREVDKLVEDGLVEAERANDGTIHVRALGQESEPIVIVPYDVKQHNLASLMQPLRAIRTQHSKRENEDALQQSVVRMESFGYCLATKGGESYWHPPMDIKDLRKLLATPPANATFMQRRAEEAQSILQVCQLRLEKQEELIARLRDALGEDAVAVDAQRILVRGEDKEHAIPFARLRDETKSPEHRLLNDEGMSALKRLAQQYDVPRATLSEVQTAIRTVDQTGHEVS